MILALYFEWVVDGLLDISIYVENASQRLDHEVTVILPFICPI